MAALSEEDIRNGLASTFWDSMNWYDPNTGAM